MFHGAVGEQRRDTLVPNARPPVIFGDIVLALGVSILDGRWNAEFDLNLLLIFAKVAEFASFTGAANSLGVARSSVCRRVAQLEEKLGVRLVQRDTRHFTITDIGKEFQEHCIRAVAAANTAFDQMALARKAPSGWIRLACPLQIGQMLVSPLVPKFVERHPGVRIAVELTDREVNLLNGFDLCIRIRQVPCEDSALVMRSLGIVQHVLVASAAFLKRHGNPTSPSVAAKLPTLSWGRISGPHSWTLVDQSDEQIHVRHEPTMIADDIGMIRQAAVDGLGIAQLPLSACSTAIEHGLLQLVLPDHSAPLHEIQAVFPSRRGLLPAVRSFIDFLAAHSVNEVPTAQIKRHARRGSQENVRFWTSRAPIPSRAE